MKKFIILVMLFALLLVSCTVPEPVATPSATSSPTLPATLPPTLTATLLPPTATPAPLLIEGTLTIKVNVRSGPGTTYASLGQLGARQKVQIISRDSSSSWYQILYPSAPQGHGWVAALYVTVPAGTQVPLDATPTPAGPTGRIIQRLNVRSGPGTSFNSLGMLDPGQVVSLTGKNTTASWFQIDFPAGPGGRAWVTAQYIQTDATASLPVLDDYGNLITPGLATTASGSALTSTPTLGPAYADGDSSANPAARITFSATGTRQFTFSSQVSTPQGDGEDWLEFTPYSTSGTDAHLVLSLVCSGNSTLTVELWQHGASFSGWGSLSCGDTGKSIHLPTGEVYQLHLEPTAGSGLQLVAYTLTIQNNP